MHADAVFVCHHADTAAPLDRHDTTSKDGIVETAGMTAESGEIAAITENGVAIGIVATAGKRSRPASKAGLIFCSNGKTCVWINVAFPRRSLPGSIVDFATTPGGSGSRLHVGKLIVDRINQILDAAR